VTSPPPASVRAPRAAPAPVEVAPAGYEHSADEKVEVIHPIVKGKHGPPVITRTRVATKTTVDQPAWVRLNLGLTLNLGNFESARVDVSLRSPCSPSDLDQAYEKTREWVCAKIIREVNEVRSKHLDMALQAAGPDH
jgi:hypothetical protein